MQTDWTGVLNRPNQNLKSASYASFTAVQDVSPLPILSVPANTISPGQLLKLVAYGTFSTTGTPTLQLGFYWGAAATQFAISAATATPSGAVTLPWRIELDVEFRGSTDPAVVPVMSQGHCDQGTTVALVTRTPLPPTALATVNMDLTVAKNLGPCAAWSASSASNIVVCHYFKARLED